MKSAVFPVFLPLLLLIFVIVSGGSSDGDVDIDSTGTVAGAGIGIGAGIGRKPMISTGNDNARRPLSYFTSLLPLEGTD